ncbi:MAG: TonB-dependent receptor [Proteobacteria bacterium]|nr:TonB-dependent receptor [Pseudomonadota bacterium]
MIFGKTANLRRALLASTVIAGFGSVAAFNTAAIAQDQDADDAIEEIIVTGTRLKNTAVSSPVPILQVTALDISGRGVVRIEEMLNILPQVLAAQTAIVVNGASGTSSLNLRGLGANRTLVLINGKRLPFGGPRTSAPNIDIIPAGLIERVDIVTGGGSAVYGSDAVGGIANFILKQDFEGVSIDAQVGVHHAPNQSALMADILTASGIPVPGAAFDGREVSVNATFGGNFDGGRGNVTLYFGYQNANAISQANRDFSACALSSRGGINRNHVCAGSSNFRKFTPGTGHGLRHDGTGNILRVGDPGYDTAIPFGEVFQEADGTLVVRTTSAEEETFNFGPFNFFRRPNERYNINALAHYEITDTVEAYADVAFMNNFTDAQIAPSASFNRPFKTNCDNPLLQNGGGTLAAGDPNILTLFELFGCQQVLDDSNLPVGDPNFRDNVDIFFTNSHRNVEGGNRNLAFNNTQWRIVTGFRGTFADRFDWDLFGQISRVNETRQSSNDLNFNDVQQALFVVTDAGGNIVCRDQTNGCVPWNITDRTSSGDSLVTDAAADFIAGNGIVIGRTEQRVIGGTIQSDLTDYGIKSPMADAGASILAGFEYRRDHLKSIPDDISQACCGQGLTGTGGATLPVEGQVVVWELFGELQIPLVQNQTGMEELSLSGAFRHSEYSTDGNGVQNTFGTNTFFGGVSWSPVSQIRVRAQFQRAIRAPNVIDLFTGQNTGLVRANQLSNGAFDPCAGDGVSTVPAATLAQCQNTGLPAALYLTVPLQPAGQLNIVTGGNPNLFAETSDTLTIGVVITPEAVPGLTIAIDYFDISIDDAIGTVPPQTTLDNCIATGNPVFCDLIVRDRFGSLWLDNSNFEGIRATNVNIATLTTKGVDVQVDYDMDMETIGLEGMGSVRFNFVGTYVDEASFVPLPGEDLIECAGLFAGACGQPTPSWRHVVRATWNTPWDVSTTLTWRYTGSATNEGVIADPTDLNLKVTATNYIDLVVRYQVKDAIELRFGVNNLLAQEPPWMSLGTNGNVWQGQFDIDRFMFFGMNFSY